MSNNNSLRIVRMRNFTSCSSLFEHILDFNPHCVYKFLVSLLAIDFMHRTLLTNISVLINQIGCDQFTAIAMSPNVARVDLAEERRAPVEDLLELRSIRLFFWMLHLEGVVLTGDALKLRRLRLLRYLHYALNYNLQ